MSERWIERYKQLLFTNIRNPNHHFLTYVGVRYLKMKAIFAIFCKNVVTGITCSLGGEQNLLQTKQRFMMACSFCALTETWKKFGFPSQANTAQAVNPDLFDLDVLSIISVFLVSATFCMIVANISHKSDQKPCL